MKHKFKPSVGSNRARKAAPGGGRGEKQSSGVGQDQPAAAVVRSEKGQNVTSSSSSEVDATCSAVLGVREEVCPAPPGATVSGETSVDAGNQVVRMRGEEGEEESGGSGGTVEDSAAVGDSAPPQSQVAPTSSSSSSSSSVRVRKKVAPTVTTGRLRRSKPDNSNHDQANPGQDRPVNTSGQVQSTSLTDVEMSNRSRGDGVSVEDPQAGDSLDCQSYTSPPGTFSHGHNESAVEGTTVETQSHSDGLSGVVRSSLDLVCPPPTGDEGATFQLGREEQRHTTAQCVISSDGEEGRQEPDDGGKVEVGQEGERGTVCEDMTSVTKEPTGEGNTETSGGGRDKETKKTRSRKRPSQSKMADATTSQGAKKRRTVGGGGGGGGDGGSRGSGRVRKAPDRTSMTMQELIYYNPSANPMSSSVEERKRRSQQAETSPVEKDESSRSSSRVQTPAPPGSDASSEVSSDPWGDGLDEGRLVPQLRMDKDGSIILDEDSMVVAATARPLPFEDPLSTPLVEGSGHTTSASYRRSSRVTRWTGEETTVFFKALSQVGTDFTMMTLLLPKRTRKELKNKFKKEEKSNPHRVSQALRNQITVKSCGAASSVPQATAQPATPSDAPT